MFDRIITDDRAFDRYLQVAVTRYNLTKCYEGFIFRELRNGRQVLVDRFYQKSHGVIVVLSQSGFSIEPVDPNNYNVDALYDLYETYQYPNKIITYKRI